VVLGALASVAVSGWGRVASAQEITAAECVTANEQAGPLRRAGKLRELRDNLRRCSVDTCPKLVRKDCIAGAEQANAEIPTIVFAVHDGAGNELSAVAVTVDGGPFLDHLDGTAAEVDPGDHLFAFESPGLPRIEKRFLILEGEKNRHEHVLLGEPAPTPVVMAAPPPVLTPIPVVSSSRRTTALVIGGSGLGLLAVGAVSGFLAVSEWSSAKEACGSDFPVSCKNPTMASTYRNESLVAAGFADVTLGLGAVALVTGAVMLLTSPASPPAWHSAARVHLAPQLGPSSAGFVLGGTF
jgi:hypothetical protein